MNVLKARPGMFFIAAMVLVIMSIPLLQVIKPFNRSHTWASPIDRPNGVYLGQAQRLQTRTPQAVS